VNTAATSYPLCLSHYWPVTGNSVNDLIGGKQPSSSSPSFGLDRFGQVNEALLVNSTSNFWQLPSSAYFQTETTVTMWVNKNKCVSGGSFGNFIIKLLLITNNFNFNYYIDL
jgi:hypothetical protein